MTILLPLKYQVISINHLPLLSLLLVLKDIPQQYELILVLGFHYSTQWPISSKYNPNPVSAARRLSFIQILLARFYLLCRGMTAERAQVKKNYLYMANMTLLFW